MFIKQTNYLASLYVRVCVFLHLSQKQLANPVEFFYINNFIICCISNIAIPTDFIQQFTIIQSLAFFPAIHSSIYLAPYTLFLFVATQVVFLHFTSPLF